MLAGIPFSNDGSPAAAITHSGVAPAGGFLFAAWPDTGADATSRKRALSAKAVRILTIAKCDGSLSVSL